MDKNLFRDSQLLNSNQRWELKCQSQTSGVNSEGVPYNGSNWDTILLAGIISDTEVGMSVNNSFDTNRPKGLPEKMSELVAKANQAIDIANANVTLASNALDDLKDAVEASDPWDVFPEDLQKFGSSANDWINSKLGGIRDTVGDLLNSQLVVGTDYVKMFKSSTPTYDIPPINTIFYDGDIYQDDEASDGLVLNKLDELIDRFVSHYHVLSATVEGSEASNPSNPIDRGGLLGIMFAPNNYRADFRNIGRDVSMDGTFELNYGGHVYKNLLVSSFSFKLSTFKKIGPDGKPTNQPLYAEISMSFEPCTLITNGNMKNFIRGK